MRSTPGDYANDVLAICELHQLQTGRLSQYVRDGADLHSCNAVCRARVGPVLMSLYNVSGKELGGAKTDRKIRAANTLVNGKVCRPDRRWTGKGIGEFSG